jgi:hypothetical protein
MRDTFATYMLATKLGFATHSLSWLAPVPGALATIALMLAHRKGAILRHHGTPRRVNVSLLQTKPRKDRRTCRPGIRGQENARVRRGHIFFYGRSKGSVDG